VERDAQVYFYGRPPGSLPSPEEVLEEIKKVYEEAPNTKHQIPNKFQ